MTASRSLRFLKPSLLLAGILAPALPLSLYFAGNWYSFFHSYSLGMACGLAALAYFLNTLILSARLRLLDRIFGHNRVLVFHGWTALAAFGLSLGHLYFKYIYSFAVGMQTLLGAVGLFLFGIVITLTLCLMIDGQTARLPGIRQMRNILLRRSRLDYSGLKFFHNFTALAALLIAAHILLASSTRERTGRTLLMTLWAGISLMVWLFHKAFKPLLLKKNPLVVLEISHPVKNVCEIRMTGCLKHLARRRAGQFGYFRFLSPACGFEEHPFTFSSAPAEDLAVTVKNLGDYTERLGRITPGTKVLCDGPYGLFTPDRKNPPHLFLAGGIGITPFLSILTDWSRSGPEHFGLRGPVTLLWSLRHRNELLHEDFFTDMTRKHPLFRFLPLFSRDDKNPRRITLDLLAAEMPGQNPTAVSAYICGPASFRTAVTAHLKALGLPARRIRSERF